MPTSQLAVSMESQLCHYGSQPGQYTSSETFWKYVYHYPMPFLGQLGTYSLDFMKPNYTPLAYLHQYIHDQIYN